MLRAVFAAAGFFAVVLLLVVARFVALALPLLVFVDLVGLLAALFFVPVDFLVAVLLLLARFVPEEDFFEVADLAAGFADLPETAFFVDADLVLADFLTPGFFAVVRLALAALRVPDFFVEPDFLPAADLPVPAFLVPAELPVFALLADFLVADLADFFFSPPPVSLLTVAQARPSASFSLNTFFLVAFFDVFGLAFLFVRIARFISPWHIFSPLSIPAERR